MSESAKVTGRCPACRGDSLHVMDGGHITCSRLDCPNPTAADILLAGASILTTEWGVEQDLPIARTGGPSRHVRRIDDRAMAGWVMDGARQSPVQTNPVLMCRTVAYGPWEPVPAEETSTEAERRQMACPMTHLPEMACGACGKPAEGTSRA